MLTAHANTPIAEFVAQLRTYVIALGLSTQVVDCVDRLADVDELEREHEMDLQEAKESAAKEMKEDILVTVQEWCRDQEMPLLSEPLLAVIEAV